MTAAERAIRQSRTGLLWPLTQGARADSVAKRISRAIQLGLLPDGEQLPAEAEFAAQMGVSPMTLREAFSILREQGLVETRRGRTGGTFVRGRSEPPLDALWLRLGSMTVTELRDLSDGQCACEGMAAMLAAERAPQMTVRRLFTLIDQLEAARNLSDVIRADSRFHIEVAIASQSERLLRSTVDLQTETGDLIWTPADDTLDTSVAVAEHRQVAEAIAAGDGERARILAEQHIHGTLAQLIELHNVASISPGTPVGPPAATLSHRNSAATAETASAENAMAELTTKVRGLLEGFFTSINTVATAFFAAIDRADGKPTRTDLSLLDNALRRELNRQPMAEGFGVALAPGVVGGRERHLEWLHRAGDKITPLRVNLDSSSVNLYDYLDMDWYTLARDRNARCVYGPFLDFTGADYYVTTMTVPLHRDGTFYGIAGADIRMSALERELMRLIGACPFDVVLLNSERAVVAANTSRWVLGSRLHTTPKTGRPAENTDGSVSGTYAAVGEVGGDSDWLLALTPPAGA